ncbi:MAG: hypothetical protein SynsKO_26380 [Synoicihabitans sp.]
MSDKLIQVTSTDVLLDNGMRVTWQGFRPAESSDKKPTTYFTTLPGDGTSATEVSMVEIGAQGADYPVEVTLLSGDATLDGTPLQENVAVILPGVGSGDAAKLVFSSETCTLKVCPKANAESGGEMRMGDAAGGEGPPPPYPGGGNNHN